MEKRILSNEQSSWLFGEMRYWRDQGVLQAEQAVAIEKLYAPPDDAPPRPDRTRSSASALQHNWFVFALRSVAALMVGLAVLLVIGYNWEAMPAAVKLVLILGSLAGVQSLAFWLRGRPETRLRAEVAFFFGNLLYGAAIWLISQVFQVSGGWNDGFFWWALGVLPFALFLDTALSQALLALLLLGWGLAEFSYLDHNNASLSAVLVNRLSLLPLLVVPSLIWAYRKGSPFTLAAFLPVLTLWVLFETGVMPELVWHNQVSPYLFIHILGGLAATLLILAESHPNGNPFAVPYRFYGVLLVAGLLVPFSYFRMNFDMSFWTRQEAWNGLAFLAELLLPMAIALATLFLAERLLRPQLGGGQEEGSLLQRQSVPLLLPVVLVVLTLLRVVILPPEGQAANPRHGFGFWYGMPSFESAPRPFLYALLTSILANLGLLVLSLWLIRVALRTDRARPFVAGVCLLLLWCILRYIDLFGQLGGMLGAAMMFFLCGAAVYGVAHFWANRKEIRHV